jgi:hypothetical protein
MVTLDLPLLPQQDPVVAVSPPSQSPPPNPRIYCSSAPAPASSEILVGEAMANCDVDLRRSSLVTTRCCMSTAVPNNVGAMSPVRLRLGTRTSPLPRFCRISKVISLLLSLETFSGSSWRRRPLLLYRFFSVVRLALPMYASVQWQIGTG